MSISYTSSNTCKTFIVTNLYTSTMSYSKFLCINLLKTFFLDKYFFLQSCCFNNGIPEFGGSSHWFLNILMLNIWINNFMNKAFFLLMDEFFLLLMDDFLFFHMIDWLNNFMDMFLMNDWLMEFMNDRLMMLVYNFSVVFFYHILMVFMDHLLMLFLNNWSLFMDFHNGFILMLYNFYFLEGLVNHYRFIMFYHNCLFIYSLDYWSIRHFLTGAGVI